MHRRLTRIALLAIGASSVLVTVAIAVAVTLTERQLGPPPLAAAKEMSEIVVDRNGNLLRPFTTSSGYWRLPVEPDDVDRRYLDLLFAFEDRRFNNHSGVDVLALVRAASQLVLHARPVSGGSTLTMQVARLLDRRHDRSLASKWLQIVRALQLERQFTKQEILRLYLNLAPFGGNLEGVRAASLAYFGKEPRRLSLGQAALLVALPQSPENRRPDRAPRNARTARDRVLAQAQKAGIVNLAEAARARTEDVPVARRPFPKLAPHFAEQLVAAKDTNRRVHKTTLDRDVQQRLEALAAAGVEPLGKRLSVAILVADHRTGEILARVGSSGYFDAERLGAIDMIDAVRSPGSTLKPMIYAMAFELGLAHPETFIEDRPARFGSYAPKNFDNDYRGTVTVREALSLSLNIPVVKLLDKIGPGSFVTRLRHAGLAPQFPEAGLPSLAVGLGGVGLTLRELTGLYAGIANRGQYVRLRDQPGDAPDRSAPGEVLSPVAAWYVSDILRNAPAPDAARTGHIAYKTGTSYGYRDAWAIGFDGRHVIGVWVGRADATSTPGLIGRTAAAPILFDAFTRVARTRTPLRPPPDGALRVAGGDLPPPLRRFREGTDLASSSPFIESPVRIAFPPDRAEVALEDAATPIVLKANGRVMPLTWMIDDAPVGTSAHDRTFTWDSSQRGFIKVSVIDAKGQVDRVVVRLR